jgi:hypothetical protein
MSSPVKGKGKSTASLARSGKNSIAIQECLKSDERGLKSLSGFRHTLDPFVSRKVARALEVAAQKVRFESLMSRTKKPSTSTSGTTSGTTSTLVDGEGVQRGGAEVEAVEQPASVKGCVMRTYQIEGLSWLIDRYDRSINCILADEMGLGKTLQSIAFIAYTVHVRRLPGPHLVVVPLSVMFNWMAEFRRWCPALKVLRIHAYDKDEQARLRQLMSDPRQAEVVVTTYDAIKSEGWRNALHRMVWRSVILDEGHRIKNEGSRVSRACATLKARFKVRSQVELLMMMMMMMMIRKSLTAFECDISSKDEWSGTQTADER